MSDMMDVSDEILHFDVKAASSTQMKIFRLELLHVHVDDLTKLRPTCDIHRGY